VFRWTCGDDTRVLPPPSHTGLRVQRAPGIPRALTLRVAPRPHLGRAAPFLEGRATPSRGDRFMHNSGASRRGNADAYLESGNRHCDERKRRSNPELSPRLDLWIASRSLSAGALCVDPLARNDGQSGSLKMTSKSEYRCRPGVRRDDGGVRGKNRVAPGTTFRRWRGMMSLVKTAFAAASATTISLASSRYSLTNANSAFAARACIGSQKSDSGLPPACV
jgi:hypothetical protein